MPPLVKPMLAIASIMVATVPVLAAQKEYLQPRALTETEKQILQAGFGRDLRDPDSIKIRWTHFRQNKAPNEASFYCATYNAKNAYGAYTGFRPFLAGIKLVEGKIARGEMVRDDPKLPASAQDKAAVSICSLMGLDPFDER